MVSGAGASGDSDGAGTSGAEVALSLASSQQPVPMQLGEHGMPPPPPSGASTSGGRHRGLQFIGYSYTLLGALCCARPLLIPWVRGHACRAFGSVGVGAPPGWGYPPPTAACSAVFAARRCRSRDYSPLRPTCRRRSRSAHCLRARRSRSPACRAALAARGANIPAAAHWAGGEEPADWFGPAKARPG